MLITNRYFLKLVKSTPLYLLSFLYSQTAYAKWTPYKSITYPCTKGLFKCIAEDPATFHDNLVDIFGYALLVLLVITIFSLAILIIKLAFQVLFLRIFSAIKSLIKILVLIALISFSWYMLRKTNLLAGKSITDLLPEADWIKYLQLFFGN